MKIAVGADHAGAQLKNKIMEVLTDQGHEVKNFGTDTDESVDYPDFGHPVANDIETGMSDLGIVVCGSGNGISMAVNKHNNVRAAICWNTELAELARQHNDANILSLPARFISEEEGLKIVEAFLNAEFEGGRHQRRVNKINLHE